MDIPSVIAFMKEIEGFKACLRDCRTSAPGRAESDAEHSWHLAVFLLLLEKEFKNVDFPRILKMALIHDLPELYAGDANPYRGDVKDKEEKERKAAEQLFSGLPGETGGALKALFEEYQGQETPESRIVKAADKLMPLIQNIVTNERFSSYREREVVYREVVAYMSPYFGSGGVLAEFYDRLLQAAREQGVFFGEGGNP